MARYTGPRNKRARRIGQDLGLKTNPKSLERRINTLPGTHGRKGKGKVSDFGIQLNEKQKAKAIYGILERQFKQYYIKASRNPQATGQVMLSLLERRLDNAVYRLGFAPTRRAARQLVTHGNVKVDGKKVDIASYQTKPGQTISIAEKAQKFIFVSPNLTDKVVPSKWLSRTATEGKIDRLPTREEIGSDIKENLIIEFYSR